jgi:hypothetical protein
VSRPVARNAAGLAPAQHAKRRVVMVTSPGAEATLDDVVINLATVSAEVGQTVAILGTRGLAAPADSAELPLLTAAHWTTSGNGDGGPTEDKRARLQTGPVDPADVEGRLGETGVPGVSRLDLRLFVGHPAQVVIRVPEVVAALQEIVDVVILEVPSFLSIHHGEGLAPLADAVLVVGERQTTKLNEVRKTGAALTRLGLPVVGMALTRAPEGTYLWGRDSEFEDADEEPDGTHETAQLPIAESPGVGPATREDDEEAMADHLATEA